MCADACTGTAAAVTAFAACARLYPFVLFEISITACTAVAAVGSVAARGVQRAAADDVERVARRQFNARAAADGGGGIGSRAGNRFAGGDVEIHRAEDGQAAAARGWSGRCRPRCCW